MIPTGAPMAEGYNSHFATINSTNLLYYKQYKNGSFQSAVTDGTESGTQTIKQVGIIYDITGINNHLYFWSSTSNPVAYYLWVSDGSVDGTVQLKEFTRTCSSNGFPGFVGLNGKVHFGANDGEYGIELWETEGTTSGTVMTRDIN